MPDPAASAKVPAAHGKHHAGEAMPCPVENEPGLQAAQAEEPAMDEYFPEAHREQLPAATAPAIDE